MDPEQSAASPRPATAARPPAPIFVIGAPRSGTSILTWCLGQHPDILPLEESGWIGDFACDVGAAHARGSARGERAPLVMLGVGRDECFAAFGACIDGLILGHRGALERASRRIGARDPAQVHAALAVMRAGEPKTRWVDGAPENSFHICGLQRLFPYARFVHIVREVDDVVASMLRFRHADGSSLVAGAGAAFDYWLRVVRACIEAEQALGPAAVLRIRYADLCAAPEDTLCRVLAFIEEPYVAACAGAMAVRVSCPQGPAPDAVGLPADPDTREQARRLSAMLQDEPQAPVVAAAARAAFEAAFDRRVEFIAALDAGYGRAQATLAQRDRELHERTAWAQQLDRDLARLRRLYSARAQQLDDEIRGLRADLGIGRKFLAGAGVMAAAGGMVALGWTGTEAAQGREFLLWVALAFTAAAGYAWLRRRGVLAVFAALMARGERGKIKQMP